jgi:hypothetical protein
MSLTALLDVLLPGDGDFPPASATTLPSRLLADPPFAGTVPPILAALNDGITAETVGGVERDHPAAFAALLTGVYSLYYTDPGVAAALARLTGYQTRPPQPAGYDLPAFDPALLAIPAARAPLYRPTPEVLDD